MSSSHVASAICVRAIAGAFAAGLIPLLTACSSGDRSAADIAVGTGTLLAGTHAAAGGDYPWLLYLPVGHGDDRALPLYVMLHGCSTSAEQQMLVNGLNPLADREGFAVLYPDVTPLHARHCWRAVFGSPADRSRGAGGDADAIAAMVQTVLDSQPVDPQRVYLMGMSSGGFAAASTAAAWPELFAAVGVVAAGNAQMDVSCAAQLDAQIPIRVQVQVQLAQGTTRLAPLLAVGGSQDALRLGSNAEPGGCARLAFREWQALAQALEAQSGEARLDTAAARTDHGSVRGGRDWVREREFSTAGCLIGEYWDVAGMGHYWPGGSADPALAAFTDPLAPNGAELSWAFFAPLRRGEDGGTRC